MRFSVSFALAVVFACFVLSRPVYAEPISHAVVAGDTLWSIAEKYHVSVADLEVRNHLTDRSILALGQSIVVADAPAARNHVPAKAKTTKVRRSLTRARVATASVPATRNAVWIVTHSGLAPAPPSDQPFNLAERILAFDARVTHTALRYVGVPYVWGGTSLSGVDCSGFVQAVFEHNGISLPRTADSQFEVGRAVKMRDLEPGDLVFFETYEAGASHVGIYLGGGRFIHASSSDGVRVDDLAMDYYAARYIGARRLIR